MRRRATGLGPCAGRCEANHLDLAMRRWLLRKLLAGPLRCASSARRRWLWRQTAVAHCVTDTSRPTESDQQHTHQQHRPK